MEYPRCKSLGLIEALKSGCNVQVFGEYPRCKSLGLIEAPIGIPVANGRYSVYPRCKSLGLIEAYSYSGTYWPKSDVSEV